MASYQFLSPEGESVGLSRVDDRLRKDFDLEPDEVDYSAPYTWTVEAGFAVLTRTSETVITPEVVEKYLELKKDDAMVNEAFEEFIKKYAPYLDGTIFTFTAWR